MAERALVAKPKVEAAAPKRSAGPRVRPAADAFEREAERVADSVMSGRGDAHPRRPLPRLLSTVNGSLAGHGRGLDEATRTFMESRFGYDFGRVRVHTDERAAGSARAVQALAYTSGASIVFSTNTYSPHSPVGRRLLAHELTHVVQQSHAIGLLHGIQRAPNPAPATAAPTGKWFQEAIDQVQVSNHDMDEQAKRGGPVIEPSHFDTQKALLELCEAVDRKANDEVPKKLDALFKVGIQVYFQILTRDLLTELSARMYEMGLEKDAERLRKAYAEGEKIQPYDPDIYASRRRVAFLTRLVAGATADAKGDAAATVTSSMHQFVRAFVAVRDEYLRIDMQALKDEIRFRTGKYTLRPMMSREEYYDAIREQMELWQRGLSTFIQTAMDAARKDLESPTPTGTGAELLKALREAMVGELRAELFPKDSAQNISNQTFQITHTEMGKGKGTISDEFAKGKESRQLPITTYDPEQEWARELRASLERFYRVRIDQLNVLGRVYGVLDALEPKKDFADTMRNAEKAKDNAETIRRMSGGRLRLDSDDDWRVFLLQKFNDLTKPPVPAATTTQSGTPAPTPTAKKPLTSAEALHEIIDLLFTYLKAFTVHARFTNIYDVGEVGYINRPFPRALTGQAVHDCGVYALRVAYMLSLVRNELGLRFRFVVLPVHVSLVITGDKMPAYIIENDSFTEISAADLDQKRKDWEKFKDPDTKAAPPGKADEEQFVAELAASDFIRGPVDMPFQVTDVPKPVKDAKAEQKQLWAYYQQKATVGLLGPSSKKKDSPNFQFELRYLALTEKGREMYNEAFLPFWNKDAPDAWDKWQAKLGGDPAKRTPGTAPRKTSVGDILESLRDYRADYDKAVQPVKARYDDMEKEMRRLSEQLRSDPGLAKAGVRLSSGPRANMFWSYYWEIYTSKLDAYTRGLTGRSKKEDEPIDAASKELDPPWMPRDDKRQSPLD